MFEESDESSSDGTDDFILVERTSDAAEEAAVQDVIEEAAVRDVIEEAAVRDATEGATVQDATEGATVQDATEEAAVRDATEGAAVRDSTEGATVRDVIEGATVRDATEETSIPKPFALEVLYRRPSFCSTIGFDMDTSISYILATFTIFSLMFIKYSSTHSTKESYYYSLNIIPALMTPVFCYKHVNIQNISNMFAQAMNDFIFLKYVFIMLDEMKFTQVSCCMGGVITAIEAFDASSVFVSVFCLLFSIQLMIITLTTKECFLIFTPMVVFIVNSYKNSKTTEFHYARMFLLSLLFLLDLALGIDSAKIGFFQKVFFTISFHAYMASFLIFMLLYEYLNKLSWAFSLVNAIFVIGNYIYERTIKQIEDPIEIYINKATMLISISLVILSKICNKNKIVRTFPPKNLSIYEFTTSSLPHFISQASYDSKIVRISKKFILPRTKSEEFVLIKLLDYKLIGTLHILNELVRSSNNRVLITNPSTIQAVNDFSNSYYDALTKAHDHRDSLDEEIDDAINNIIDHQNDIITSVLHTFGFFEAGMNYFFRSNTYMQQRINSLAKMIETSINEEQVPNIVFVANTNRPYNDD